MTTYNTYQEAKIANPECDIYRLEKQGLFTYCDYHTSELVRFIEFDSAGIKCNPADYCMTVEKFLADGYRFVDGDKILDEGSVYLVTDCKTQNHRYETESANEPDCDDDRRYILRAAALEEDCKKQLADIAASIGAQLITPEKKPRTKVEYVKSDIESRGRALDAFDNEIELFELVGGEYEQVTTESDAISKWRNLYEHIETPMTEREAFVSEATGVLSNDNGTVTIGEHEVIRSLFDAGCRFVN